MLILGMKAYACFAGRMRVSPVESLDRPAEVFESYAGGLLKMGTFPLRAIPYVPGAEAKQYTKAC